MFPPERFPRLCVGLDPPDDAAVYQVTDEVAVICTVDFFTPVVDDPYDYGAIAAANAMSDVYAMGGEVAFALNVCGFPSCLSEEVVAQIVRGGAEKVDEAGGALAGGHTIEAGEPLYGLAVVGTVHPSRILTKRGAAPGDVLVLTKPLGVGIVTTAAKADAADLAHLAGAVESMKRLNRAAARAARLAGVHACTDITGFGLLGHAWEMAEGSNVSLHFDLQRLPFLDGARRYAEEWLFPGGTCRNQECYAPHVSFAPQIPEEVRQLLFTPETSGGLLLSVPPDSLEALARALTEARQPFWTVGWVREGTGIVVDT